MYGFIRRMVKGPSAERFGPDGWNHLRILAGIEQEVFISRKGDDTRLEFPADSDQVHAGVKMAFPNPGPSWIGLPGEVGIAGIPKRFWGTRARFHPMRMRPDSLQQRTFHACPSTMNAMKPRSSDWPASGMNSASMAA